MLATIAEVAYSSATIYLGEVEKNYSVIDKIGDSFNDIFNYKTIYPYSLLIMVGLVSRVKRLVATSAMAFAFTNGLAINKIGYNLFKKTLGWNIF